MKLDLRVLGPLLLLGFVAGALRVFAQRSTDPTRRKLLVFAWIALLLFGVPLWMFLAATLRLF